METRTHSCVRHETHVLALVEAIINRQHEPFHPEDVHDLVNGFLEGSEFHDNDKLIKQFVNQTIDFNVRTHELYCREGVLYPTNIDGEVIPQYYNENPSKINPHYRKADLRLAKHSEYY